MNRGTELPGAGRIQVWLLAVAAIAAACALAVGLTGGFDISIGGVRIRSRSWVRPALAAGSAAVLLTALARHRIVRALERTSTLMDAPGSRRALVAGAAAWTLAAGVWFGTFAAGGADSYGYVGQARLLALGRLTDTVAISPLYTWPDAAATLTPLGFTPGTEPGEIAPRYPPGLPLLLAPLTRVSETSIYLLVPAFGILLVWLTWRLGALAGDPLAGAVGAVALAASPTFLYQLVQPMSDVPAAACWLAALLASSRGTAAAAAGAGALSSMAILIRPNLAPLAAIVAVSAVFAGPAARGRRAGWFLAATIPGLAVLGWIQDVRYGSPLGSGYGTVEEGFSMSFIVPNLARYPRWLTETHTPFVWLSLLFPLWTARRAPRRMAVWPGVALTAAVWGAYLPYVYFQPHEWSYTRFLLPALAPMLVYAAAVALVPLRRLPPAWRVPATALLLGGLVVAELHAARGHGVFAVRRQETKYPLAGRYVRDQGPPNAFVLAAQHSGSIRYYAGRPTLRWDLLAPTQLDHAVATLRAQGYAPLLVVDAAEYEDFRTRFGGQDSLHALTPLAVLGDAEVFAFR